MAHGTLTAMTPHTQDRLELDAVLYADNHGSTISLITNPVTLAKSSTLEVAGAAASEQYQSMLMLVIKLLAETADLVNH